MIRVQFRLVGSHGGLLDSSEFIRVNDDQILHALIAWLTNNKPTLAEGDKIEIEQVDP